MNDNDKRDGTRIPSGIRARHSRSCPSHSGGACACIPSWEAGLYSKRDARKVRRTFRTLPEAKRWVTQQRQGRDEGTLRAPARVSLKDAAQRFLDLAESGAARNRSGDPYKPSAIRSYRTSLHRHVLPRIGHTRLSEVTRGQLQRLVAAWQEEGQSPSTIQNSINALRAVYANADLLTSGAIPINPTRDLRLPARRGKRERIASVDEAARLIAALPEAERALWATAFYAGLRRGELRALRWENVDLASGTISVVASWDDRHGEISPKSRSGVRSVPIIANLRPFLIEHRALTGRTSGYVFGRAHDVVFMDTTARNRALRAWRTAGLAPIGLHEARHTFASYLLAAGVDFKHISVFMGHASVAFTMDRYAHLLPDSQAETVALIDAFLGRADTSGRLAQLDGE
jgi:integrase